MRETFRPAAPAALPFSRKKLYLSMIIWIIVDIALLFIPVLIAFKVAKQMAKHDQKRLNESAFKKAVECRIEEWEQKDAREQNLPILGMLKRVRLGLERR